MSKKREYPSVSHCYMEDSDSYHIAITIPLNGVTVSQDDLIRRVVELATSALKLGAFYADDKFPECSNNG